MNIRHPCEERIRWPSPTSSRNRILIEGSSRKNTLQPLSSIICIITGQDILETFSNQWCMDIKDGPASSLRHFRRSLSRKFSSPRAGLTCRQEECKVSIGMIFLCNGRKFKNAIVEALNPTVERLFKVLGSMARQVDRGK